MSYTPRRCPLCGAYLDPGESCDCTSDSFNAYLYEEIEGVPDG